MVDRIAEIREALEVPARPVPDTVPDMRGLYALPLDVLDERTRAARAYADLLDSDALKINLDSAIPNPNSTVQTRKALVVERDENGRWPDWVLDVSPGDEQWTLELLDALASSQGVEP